MTDRPIIFSAPMVQALLAGRKTQTRRILKAPYGMLERTGNGEWKPICTRFFPNDRLYVREAFQGHTAYEAHGYKPSDWGNKPIWYCADGEPDPLYSASSRKRPSIHMPRWASRLTLTVTDVRVQRLQDISDADAKAEGAKPWTCAEQSYITDFAAIWRTIHNPEAWDANPWVVAISFDVRHGNIEKVEP